MGWAGEEVVLGLPLWNVNGKKRNPVFRGICDRAQIWRLTPQPLERAHAWELLFSLSLWGCEDQQRHTSTPSTDSAVWLLGTQGASSRYTYSNQFPATGVCTVNLWSLQASVLSLLHSPSWFFCDSLLYTTDPKPVCTVPLLLSKVSWNIIEVDELYGHPTSCKLILDIRHVLSISHIFFLHLNFVTHWANIIYTHSRT